MPHWMSLIGRRVLHADTFALMLSPAIADLQFEAPTGLARLRHDYAVLRALAGALLYDVSGDLLTVSNDLASIAVLSAIQGSYYTFMLVLLSGLGTGRLATTDVDGGLITRVACYLLGIGIACVVTSSACCWPPRRSTDAEAAD